MDTPKLEETVLWGPGALPSWIPYVSTPTPLRVPDNFLPLAVCATSAGKLSRVPQVYSAHGAKHHARAKHNALGLVRPKR